MLRGAKYHSKGMIGRKIGSERVILFSNNTSVERVSQSSVRGQLHIFMPPSIFQFLIYDQLTLARINFILYRLSKEIDPNFQKFPETSRCKVVNVEIGHSV